MKKDNKKALYESIMTSVAKQVKKVLNEEINPSIEKAKARQKKIENAYALKLKEWYNKFLKHLRKFAVTNKHILANNLVSKEDWDNFVKSSKSITECIKKYVESITNQSITESINEETKPGLENKDSVYYVIKDLVEFDKIIKAIKRTKITSENENFQQILDLSKDIRKSYHMFYNLYNKHMEDNDIDDLDVKNNTENKENDSNIKNILNQNIDNLNWSNQKLYNIIENLKYTNIQSTYSRLFDYTYFNEYDIRHICNNDELAHKIKNYCDSELEKIQDYLNEQQRDYNIKLIEKLQNMYNANKNLLQYNLNK